MNPAPLLELPGRARRWPAESRLLLQALRVALRTAPAELAWPAGLDTDKFLAGVERHRVGAFLHQRLPPEARATLPEPVRLRLAASAQTTALRAMQRTAG